MLARIRWKGGRRWWGVAALVLALLVVITLASTAAPGALLVDSGQRLATGPTVDSALGDLDGDGDLDAFLANHNAPMQVWLNNGSGMLTDSGQRLGGSPVVAMALGDVDGDHDLDAVLGNGYEEASQVWLNNGAGQFTDSGESIAGLDPQSHIIDLALGDLDGDGDLDVYMTNGSAGGEQDLVYLNNGSGHFTDSGQRIGWGFNTGAVGLGDLDGDGDLDAFVGKCTNNTRIWLNDGQGVFTDSGQLLGNDCPQEILLVDLDGDGDLDAFSANNHLTGGRGNTVYFNDGLGVFTDSGQELGQDQCYGAAYGDLNHDGSPDVVVTNIDWDHPGEVPSRAYVNDGDGYFTLAQSLSAYDTSSVSLGDLDGDGGLDAFFGGFKWTSVAAPSTVWFGTSPTATLTIIKDADQPSSQAFAFSSTIPGHESFSLTDDGNGTADRVTWTVETGTYAISETIPAGWDQTSATCSNGDTPGNLTLDPGETVTCIFRNEVDRGTVIVRKQTTPAGGQGFPFTLQAAYLYQWGGSGSGEGKFNQAFAVAVGPTGDVYVADFLNHRIQKFDENGTFLTAWGSHGSGDGQFSNPSGLTVDPDGNVYVADTQNHRIQKFDANGNFLEKWGSGESNADGAFRYPYDVEADGNGHIYVADHGNARIQKLDTHGNFITKWGSSGSGDGQFIGPVSLAVGNGRVYVSDYHNHRIQAFSPTGAFITKWGSQGSADGQFQHTWGLAVDAAGRVYVTDEQNHRIQVFDADGAFLAKWGALGNGNGQFYVPLGVAIGRSGEVYVADELNNRVQVFSPPQWATLNDGQQASFGGLFPGTYAVTEGLPNGWELASATCGNGDTPGAIGVDPGETVTCTFANRTITNYPPVAIADHYVANPNQVFNVNAVQGVLANDTDPNGDPLIALRVSPPANGSLTLNTNGGFTYVPRSGFVGSDTFVYSAYDGKAYSNDAVVTIVVDTTPIAVADTYTTAFNTSLSIPAPGVLANDSDPDGLPLSAQLVTGPTHGTLTLKSTGNFTYMPEFNFSGTDVFTYRAYDRYYLYSTPVAVTIKVFKPPVPKPDTYTLMEDGSLTVSAPGVLGNDFSPRGTQLLIYSKTDPQHGTLTLYESGYLHYQPAPNYNGWDYFRYRISDGIEASPGWATVSLRIDAVNDPPVAVADSFRTRAWGYWDLKACPQCNPTLEVETAGTLSNDQDADGDVLTLDLVSTVSRGRLQVDATGGFTYLPREGFIGTDSFRYRALDGQAWSNVVTVTIEVYDPAKVVNSSPVPFPPFQRQTAIQILQSSTQPPTQNSPRTIVVSGGKSDRQAQEASQANTKYVVTPSQSGPTTGEAIPAAPIPEGNARAGQAAFSIKQSQLRSVNTVVISAQTGQVTVEEQLADNAESYVILIGGNGTDGRPLSSTILYNPDADNWIEGPNMSEPRAGFGSAQAEDGSILIAGGFNGTGPTPSVDRYDPAAGTMTARADMLKARMDFQLVRLTSLAGVENEYFMAIGGRDANNAFLADVEVYSPSADTWTTTGSLNIARASHTATTLLDGRVLVVGGETNTGPTASAEIYDPATGQWTLTGSLSAPVVGHTATLFPDGTVLVIGDDSGESLMAIYSPGTGEWYPTANGAVGRQNHTATLLDNGQVVILGGTVSRNDTAAASTDSLAATGSETDLVEIYLIPPEVYITVVNETDPANSEAVFDFTSTMPDHATFTLDGGLDDDAVPTELRFGPFVPGEYTITELPTVRYDQSVYCDNGKQGTDSVTLNLTAGEEVVCTFTNTYRNTPPIAEDDTNSTNEDTAVSFNVLSNDSDPENGPLTATAVTDVVHGTLTYVAPGTFTYTPSPNWFGEDSFAYQVCETDDATSCDAALVFVTVGPVNDPPVAADDLIAVPTGTTADLDLLSNDSDIDSGALTIVIVAEPAHGVLAVTPTSVTYTPATGFSGMDTFTYKLNDGTADSNIATVTINIGESNHLPEVVWRQPPPSQVYLLRATKAKAMFTDPDAADRFTCTWDWGDGTPVTSRSCTPGQVTSAHSYRQVGSYTVTFTVNDGAGAVRISAPVTVIWYFGGFFEPVKNPPALNSVKAGSAIPMKFTLRGNFGLNIIASGYPQSVPISCTTRAPLGAGVATLSTSGVSYQPAGRRYTYVWKTDKAWANTCRQFQLQLVDGTLHLANFKFK